MTPAEQARANAIQCEMVKYAYRQTKDGVVVSFIVHPNDIPAALSTSHIGARFVAVLVQVGDDELPVHQTGKEAMPNPQRTPELDAKPQPDTDKRPVGAKHEKQSWRDLKPSAQAAMNCDKPVFWAFLNETRDYAIHCKETAAVAVRDICGVTSRALFDTDHAARVIWHQLDTEFQAWERVGA